MRVLRFLAGLTAALALAACARAGGDRPGDAVLRVAIARSPNTLDPILSANTTEGFINRLSFDPLISVDPTGRRLVPILASAVPTLANGGISRDGLTIVYHLRRDVTWQDGVRFTSADVAFTWRAIMNDANNVNSRNGYDQVARVQTPDDATVVFRLRRRYAPFVATVFAESDNPMCILPAHLLAGEPNLNRVAFNAAPIGTGPFRVTTWVRGDRLELVANDRYFRGRPKLRRIIIREIPDENTEIAALRTGAVDWMFEASPSTYRELRPLAAAGTIRIVLVEMPQTTRLYLNTARPPLDDVRVRRAIAFAVDRTALASRLTEGTGIPATADQPPFSAYYEPNVVRYPHDPARARALLVEAGYRFGPGGLAERSGRPLALELSYNVENATRRNAVVQIQAMLRAAGITASIKPYPANLLFATAGQGGILANAKYDLDVSGWIAGIDPDDDTLYGCDRFPPNGTNYTRYCSPTMQALQAQALSSYNEAVRKRAYSAIQQLLARDVPDIDLWYARMLQPIVPSLHNFAPNPVNEAWNAHLWEM